MLQQQTAFFFFLSAFLSESSVKYSYFHIEKMGLFTASFLPMSRAVIPFEQIMFTLKQFSHRRAAVIHRNTNHSPRRTPLIYQQRAGKSLLTFFLCHLGAPCVTATIKFIEAAKVSLPKGVWVNKGALLDHVGTGCGMLREGEKEEGLSSSGWDNASSGVG